MKRHRRGTGNFFPASMTTQGQQKVWNWDIFAIAWKPWEPACDSPEGRSPWRKERNYGQGWSGVALPVRKVQTDKGHWAGSWPEGAACCRPSSCRKTRVFLAGESERHGRRGTGTHKQRTEAPNSAFEKGASPDHFFELFQVTQ